MTHRRKMAGLPNAGIAPLPAFRTLICTLPLCCDAGKMPLSRRSINLPGIPD